MNTNDRLVHLDTLKSFSIIGVIFIHGAVIFGCSSLFSEIVADLFRFCVPVFVIIWVFFLEKSLQKNISKSVWHILLKKLKHLLIVFLVWSVLYFLILADFKTLTLSSIITKHFSGYGWAGQYYFIILFQLLLLFPLLRKIYSFSFLRNSIIALLICVYICYSFFSEYMPTFINKLGDRPFYLWIPYVFVGIALARKKFIYIPSVCALSIVLIPIEFYFFESISPYVRISILFSTTLLVATTIQHPFTITNNTINKVCTLIGNNTMTLFVANPLVIILLSALKDGYKMPYSTLLCFVCMPIFSVILIITLCLLITYLIRRIRLNGIIN